jgi:MT0933-like antitoxin protein
MQNEVYPTGQARRPKREQAGGEIVSELGDLAGKAEELAQEHPDQVKQGIEKAGQVADEKTGGQHTDQIDKAEQEAEKHLTGGSEQD